MKRIIEFGQGHKTVFVEVEDNTRHGDELSARGSAAEKARQSFEEAVAGIGPIADMILRQLSALSPENVIVEFGVKFSAEAGVILASSALEGNCKVTIGWTPKAQDK